MDITEINQELGIAIRELKAAKQEPAHSPVEDRLIDVCDSLIEAIIELTRLIRR